MKEKREREISIMAEKERKNNDEISLKMSLALNKDMGIQYGFMEYRHYHYSTSYKIRCVDKDPYKVLSSMRKTLIRYYKARSYKNLLFYQVEGIDARIVTFDLISSSGFPLTDVDISWRSNYLCHFNGNGKALELFCEYFEPALSHGSMINNMKREDEETLAERYYDFFGKNPNFTLFKKSRMRWRITKKSKKKLLNEEWNWKSPFVN